MRCSQDRMHRLLEEVPDQMESQTPRPSGKLVSLSKAALKKDSCDLVVVTVTGLACERAEVMMPFSRWLGHSL